MGLGICTERRIVRGIGSARRDEWNGARVKEATGLSTGKFVSDASFQVFGGYDE